MGEWRVVLTRTARKRLLALDHGVQVRVRDCIDKLPQGDIKKLRGGTSRYRARVGDWRVVFRLDHGNKLIEVADVAKRGDAYR